MMKLLRVVWTVEIRFHAQRSMTQSSITGLMLLSVLVKTYKAMETVAYSYIYIYCSDALNFIKTGSVQGSALAQVKVAPMFHLSRP